MTTPVKRKLRHGASCFIYLILIVIIAFFSTMTLLLVWPYHDVEIEGDARIMNSSSVFHSGEVMKLEWASYRNDGRDLFVTRWADGYNADGERIYSFGIPPYQGFHEGPTFREPSTGQLTLPNYLPPGLYKIRFEFSYQPNFIRTVNFETETEFFTLLD